MRRVGGNAWGPKGKAVELAGTRRRRCRGFEIFITIGGVLNNRTRGIK